MATGDTLCAFTALNNTYAGATSALPDRRNNHPILIFDASADWIADFHGVCPNHYGGGGTTIVLGWTAAAQTGNCVWNAAWERAQPEGEDMDSDTFAAIQAATGVPSGTSGRLTYTSITFTGGSAMDFVSTGHIFRLRVTRDADNASDTMTGTAELWTVHIYET